MSWLANAVAAVASETFTSTSAPIQYAAVTALEDHQEMASYLLHSRQILSALSNYAYKTLSDTGAVMNRSAGGFYLFPRFEAHRQELALRGIDNGQAFCEHLLEENGVAVLPGHCFGRPAQELSARIAVVDFDGGRALKQANSQVVDENFIKQHCNRVTTAIERLVAWSKS